MDPLAGWVRAAVDGDPVAVSHLVRATQSEVHRLCSHLVDPAAADDLAQETYLRALKALPGFRGEAPFRLWLLAIARRVVATALEAEAGEVRRRRRLAARRPSPAPDHTEHHALQELVSALAPERRDAFVLTQVLGLSYAEAAEVCGCEVGTIRSRVARARDQLVAQYTDVGRAATRR